VNCKYAFIFFLSLKEKNTKCKNESYIILSYSEFKSGILNNSNINNNKKGFCNIVIGNSGLSFCSRDLSFTAVDVVNNIPSAE